MNKSELVAIMAEKASLSKKDAEGALNAFVDAVKDAVKKNDKVQLVGFGTFESRKREAREGKKTQTGKKSKSPRATRRLSSPANAVPLIIPFPHHLHLVLCMPEYGAEF